ncbi:MAG: hypothetical protein ABIP95_15635 [Pelobium sp.]
MTFSKAVIIISHVPIVLTFIYVGLISKKLSHELKVFSYYIFFTSTIQFISLAFWFMAKNNLPLLHLYVAGGFMLLAWFYNTILNSFINSRIIWSLAILFLVFTIVNTVFFQRIYEFNSNAVTVESILIIIFALFTYTFFLNDIVKESTKHDIKSLNWINAGLFIYHSSTLIIFYFGTVITQSFSKSLNQYTWVFNSFFSIVMYFCFFIGFWKRSKI